MKAILLITDSEAMREFERVLLSHGHHGFTVMPAVAGSGRHGLKTGDRVHPGSSSLMLTIADAGDALPLVELLRRTRDAKGYGELTRMWSFDLAEVA
jgi:nitrogen regulatory protein P-II